MTLFTMVGVRVRGKGTITAGSGFGRWCRSSGSSCSSFSARVLLARAPVYWGYYGHRGTDARAILAERYARGEITHEEYRERLLRASEA